MRQTELLALAKQESPKIKTNGVSSILVLKEYLKVLIELREKKQFSFVEISTWLDKYDINYSPQTIRRSYLILTKQMDRETQRKI